MINNGKPRDIIPKPEDLRGDVSYAFSINPESQFFGDVKRVTRVINVMRRTLNSDTISYRIYPEVSRTGRIHFHGYLRIWDTGRFYVYLVPELLKIATITLEEIFNDEIWEDYIIKQCPLLRMKPLTKPQPLQFKPLVTDLDDFCNYSSA